MELKIGDRIIAIGPQYTSHIGKHGVVVGYSRTRDCFGIVFDGNSKKTRVNMHKKFLVEEENEIFTTV